MKTKFSQAHDDDPASSLNLTEIASDLVEEANNYVTVTDDLPDLTAAELGAQLDKMLCTETIKFFLEQGAYGRGFLSGLAMGIATLELAVDKMLARRLLELGLEDEEDMSEEDVEDVVYDGLKYGTRGIKKTGDSGQDN